MHATIEQLLAVRNREPVAAAIKEHVGVCLLCRETLDELILTRDELKRLPETAPPHDFWPDIQARAEQRNHTAKQRSRTIRYAGLGLAASMLLAAALIINQGVTENDNAVPATTPAVAGTGNTDIGNQTTKENATAQNDRSLPEQTDAKPDLDTLISRSAQLEAVLHALPQRPGIVKASTADLITGLQDGVALIDYQLNLNADKLSPDQSRQLWQQRVDLMNSLVNVRYAETRRVAYSTN